MKIHYYKYFKISVFQNVRGGMNFGVKYQKYNNPSLSKPEIIHSAPVTS